MGDKLRRVFRSQRVSSEQAAADDEIRQKVRAEFPPAEASRVSAQGVLSDHLRQVMRDCGKSSEEISIAAGVSPLLLARFLTGERDIHMATADRIAEALGVKLVAR